MTIVTIIFSGNKKGSGHCLCGRNHLVTQKNIFIRGLLMVFIVSGWWVREFRLTTGTWFFTPPFLLFFLAYINICCHQQDMIMSAIKGPCTCIYIDGEWGGTVAKWLINKVVRIRSMYVCVVSCHTAAIDNADRPTGILFSTYTKHSRGTPCGARFHLLFADPGHRNRKTNLGEQIRTIHTMHITKI